MTTVLDGGEFLRGINVHAPESRDYIGELVSFLKHTPVEWVRIHPLPSRRLAARNRAGVSYLDAITKFAEEGFNLILPIEVGVTENVGVVTGAHLERFVDDSYSEAFKAVKHVERRVSKFRVRVIYGVENELDTKEWILQSMPTIGWRSTPFAWAELSASTRLKYKRLANILEGIREASPDSPTMVNFEADDPAESWSLKMSLFYGFQEVLTKLRIIDERTRDRMHNYRKDVSEVLQRLKGIDIVGLDNYPNYFSKVPPKGSEIGKKVDEVAKSCRKPVLNVEFGYTTSEPWWRDLMIWRKDLDPNSPEDHQRQFFDNALGSIENSASQGTFPWVMFLDPSRHYKPNEEKGFSMMVQGNNLILEPLPALVLYLDWLGRIGKRVQRVEQDGRMYEPEQSLGRFDPKLGGTDTGTYPIR